MDKVFLIYSIESVFYLKPLVLVGNVAKLLIFSSITYYIHLIEENSIIRQNSDIIFSEEII